MLTSFYQSNPQKLQPPSYLLPPLSNPESTKEVLIRAKEKGLSSAMRIFNDKEKNNNEGYELRFAYKNGPHDIFVWDSKKRWNL